MRTFVRLAASVRKGGKCEFAAGANLMGAYSGSGPPTGGYNAFPFCVAAVQFEPYTDLPLPSIDEQIRATNICYYKTQNARRHPVRIALNSRFSTPV